MSIRDESYNSLRLFKKEFADHPLKESTVRFWKKYEQEIKLRHKFGKSMDIKKLESGKDVIPCCWELLWKKRCRNI